MPTAAELVTRSHRPAIRLTFLDDLDTELATAEPLAGAVQMDRNRDVRRTGNVSLANTAGAYTPTPSGLVWPYRLVRLERGIYAGTTPEYFPLVTGLIDSPRIDENSAAVSFQVWSRTRLADQQFAAPVTFAAETRLRDVLRQLAELAGFGTNDAWYVFDDAGATLPAARTFDVADNQLRAMVTLASDYALELFDDGAGRLNLRPFADPSTTTPAWDFAAGAAQIVTSLSRTLRASSVYNRAIVVGVAPDHYPIRAEAIVTNPASPLYWTPETDHPAPIYQSADIRTQGQANDVALARLYAGALYEENIAAAAVPVPWLEAGNVVSFEIGGAAQSFLLDTLSVPLGPGAMSMTTRKVQSLIA